MEMEWGGIPHSHVGTDTSLALKSGEREAYFIFFVHRNRRKIVYRALSNQKRSTFSLTKDVCNLPNFCFCFCDISVHDTRHIMILSMINLLSSLPMSASAVAGAFPMSKLNMSHSS